MSNISMEMGSRPYKTTATSRVRQAPDWVSPTNNGELSKDETVLASFGKKQQLKRRFKYVSTIGLTCGLLFTWMALLNTIQVGLVNGGPAGLICGFLGSFAGAMLQALVMGEISSMIPLAGGAFNWVAVLAPPSCRKFMSYIAGWFSVITYQAYVLATAYTCAAVIQGIVILKFPGYVPQLWHATLISYAVIIFGFFANTYLGRVLPQIESFLLLFFVLGYFAVLIPLVYLSPRRPVLDVFTTFQNLAGWDNDGIAFMVGWLATYGCFIGADGSDHIAEEVTSAAYVIPFAMWFSTLVNGLMGFGMMLAVMVVCQDYVAAAQPVTGFAFIDIFASSMNSTHGAAALASIAVASNILAGSSVIATASRALWAFARENGVPFSPWVAKLDPKTRIPYNAIIVTAMVTLLLALISVGSTAAFAAFLALSAAAYYTTFLIAACVMLHKRMTTPESEIPWGPFRLGRWGVPITVASILYTVVTLVFSFFPTSIPVTPQNMNYSIVIYGGAVLLMLGFWMVHGRRVYVGPIWELEGEYVRKN